MSKNSTATSTPVQLEEKRVTAEEAIKQFNQEVAIQRFKHIKSQGALKADVQLDRLTQQQFRNPFDVLMLDLDATDEEIKKQYRAFSLILHPDRCRDERAKDAFFMAEQAYKTLIVPEKRKVYLRIMREAKEKTEFEREKENRKRVKSGQPELPEDTFETQYRQNLEEIFDQLEEKKVHMAKLQEADKQTKAEEQVKSDLMTQYRIYTEDEWEVTRENRVNNWRNFSKKKQIVGTKSSNKGIKAPSLKQEARPDYAPKIDNSGKIVGINEDYKKKWK